jgi:hypothetical protein
MSSYVKKVSAHLFLKRVFSVLDDVAKEEKVTLVEHVSNMIKSGETLASYVTNEKYREKIDTLFRRKSVHFLLGRLRGYLSVSERDIRDAMPWWRDRIKEINPDLDEVIVVEPNGKEWFVQMFIDLVKICKGYI